MGIKSLSIIKPNFLIKIDGKEIDKSYIASINFNDEIDDNADEVTIELSDEFEIPSFESKFEVYLGTYNKGLTFIGFFFLQTVSLTNANMSLKLTSVDFSSHLKSKKNRSWKDTTLKKIVETIAKEHKLLFKCDIEHKLKHDTQTHESDMSFLMRLSKRFNLSFSIKNQTIIFTKKDIVKNDSFLIDINTVIDYRFELVNKAKYGSVILIYRDTASKKDIKIKVGDKPPTLELKKRFKNMVDGRLFAEEQLKKSNGSTISGSITIDLDFEPFAGGFLEISGSRQSSGYYNIKKVSHSVLNATTQIDFERSM